MVVDFVTFMAATSGLLVIHMVSVRETQAELRRLRGLLSVCAWCQRIRDDGDWISIEQYVATHERSDLTHGICPSCAAKELALWRDHLIAAGVAADTSSTGRSKGEASSNGPPSEDV